LFDYYNKCLKNWICILNKLIYLCNYFCVIILIIIVIELNFQIKNRMITIGNTVGICFGSFKNRFKGKADKRSNIFTNLEWC
jgi:hypothetical protein